MSQENLAHQASFGLPPPDVEELISREHHELIAPLASIDAYYLFNPVIMDAIRAC